MATVTPPTITAPPEFPAVGDAAYNTKAYTWANALPTFGTQVSAVGANVKANADEAQASANLASSNGAAQVLLATTQAGNAAVSAAAAASSALLAGATAWVSGTTYAIGAARYSLINYQTYRRVISGAGTTDPSADAVNWTLASQSVPSNPIGALSPIANALTNPVTSPDGSTWLKTGTVAARATYPNGPGCVTAVGAIYKPIPATNPAYVSYTNGLFVLTVSGVGAGVWTSADGLTWDYYPYPSGTSALGYCAFGSGKYVFEGAGANVYYTTDFVTYTTVALPDTGFATPAISPAISFSNNLFVYCCSGSNVAYLYTSPDGIAWTKRTLPNAATYLGCAYGAGRWVVTTTNGSVAGAYSGDGISWTNIPFTEIVRSAPIFANGIFICRGNTTNALTSTTGTTFAGNALPGTPATTAALAWTGTKFLCAAASGAFYSSASGTGSWTQLTTIGLVGVNLSSPVSNGSGLVVATTAGSAPLYVSDDHMASCWGINRITNSTSASVPVGNATTVVSVQATNATDITYIIKRGGVNFRTMQITSGIALTAATPSAAWNGSVYVTTLGAASTAGKSSPDGVTWTSRTFSASALATATCLSALTTNGRFVLVNGTTTGSTCTDGATWVGTATLPAAFSVVHTNGSTLLAMAAGQISTYYTSADGVTWTARTFPNDLRVTGANIGSDRVSTFALPATTQANGVVAAYFSTDAINWTLRYLPAEASSGFYNSCAAGIWTAFAVTFDAGVTWYINNTRVSAGTAAHHCLSMSVAATSTTTIDASTLLTGVDAAIVSNISGSNTAPAIPNYVRVA